jgi:hypothetical protein
MISFSREPFRSTKLKIRFWYRRPTGLDRNILFKTTEYCEPADDRLLSDQGFCRENAGDFVSRFLPTIDLRGVQFSGSQ